MLAFLPAPLLASPLKLLARVVPTLAPQTRAILSGCQENWTSMNAALFRLLPPIHWDVRGQADLCLDTWYFVIANHQTWPTFWRRFTFSIAAFHR